jgi:hypothetical protein
LINFFLFSRSKTLSVNQPTALILLDLVQTINSVKKELPVKRDLIFFQHSWRLFHIKILSVRFLLINNSIFIYVNKKEKKNDHFEIHLRSLLLGKMVVRKEKQIIIQENNKHITNSIVLSIFAQQFFRIEIDQCRT